MAKKTKTDRVKGIVQWFDTTRGYGYIKTSEGNVIFVNYTDLPIRDGDFVILRTNQQITFEIYQGDRGTQAKNIQY